MTIKCFSSDIDVLLFCSCWPFLVSRRIAIISASISFAISREHFDRFCVVIAGFSSCGGVGIHIQVGSHIQLGTHLQVGSHIQLGSGAGMGSDGMAWLASGDYLGPGSGLY